MKRGLARTAARDTDMQLVKKTEAKTGQRTSKGPGRAGQGRAGQDRAGRTGQDRPGRTGQGRKDRARQGKAGKDRARQEGQGRAERAGQGKAGQGKLTAEPDKLSNITFCTPMLICILFLTLLQARRLADRHFKTSQPAVELTAASEKICRSAPHG